MARNAAEIFGPGPDPFVANAWAATVGGISGGGGGVGAVYSGHYGGGTPTDTPTASAAVAYDLDDPFQTWKWDGSAWS